MSEAPAILVEHVSKSYRIGRSITDVPIPRGFPGAGRNIDRSRGRPLEVVDEDDEDDGDDEIDDRTDEEIERDRQRAEEPGDDRIVHALRDVSLEVARGTRLAVLGPAGSGKSTLLKIVARITPPTEGQITVRGRVSPPLDMAASFLNTRATGRQNAFIIARMFGLPKRDIKPRVEEIFEFAEIGRKIDHRIATYSTLQSRRLGVSIALHLEPDVLLVDDKLGADPQFADRVRDWILRASAKRGLTVLYASSKPQSVSAICDDAIWFGDGQIVERRPLTHAGTRRILSASSGGLAALSAEQRALVEELIAAGRSYDDIAADRGASGEQVRDAAQAALMTIAPDRGRIEPPVREAIGDYLLGQDNPPADVLEELAATPEARFWSYTVNRHLRVLTPDPLPGLPYVTTRAGYEDVMPHLETAATLLIRYLEAALGEQRARELQDAAIDKAIWRGVDEVRWEFVGDAAGLDRMEAEATIEQLSEMRRRAGLVDEPAGELGGT